MALPPLVKYATAAEYRSHYQKIYCKGNIVTADGIRVFFKPEKFEHAFFESAQRNGIKDVHISPQRAERIDWIKATLEDPNSKLFAGFDNVSKKYNHARRVTVVHGDFVVILALSLNREKALRANFITCYEADNSINKIKQSPNWDRDACLAVLGSN